jgi:hypothetical protein
VPATGVGAGHRRRGPQGAAGEGEEPVENGRGVGLDSPE